jgi:hypothetical protein
LFRDVGDRRGLAWSLSRLGLNELELEKPARGVAHLKEAMTLNADIGACSAEYREVLHSIAGRLGDAQGEAAVDAELRRMDDMQGTL